MVDIYSILAGKGRNGDTELAHITKEESNILKMLGGSGTTNPWTGLPEYNIKKKYGLTIPNWLSPHNKKHSDGTYKTARGNQHSLKTNAELDIEKREAEITEMGETFLDPSLEENIDPETGESLTIGEMGLGQEAYTAEQYQGMTPQQVVDDIFAKEYNNIVPPDFKGDETAFKAKLAGRLQFMPQFKGADPEALGFQKEAKDIAVEQASITAQAGAQQIGGAMRSAYGGMGAGMRAGVGAGSKLAQTYGLGLQTADLGYRTGVYGLEQQAGAEWEQDYTSFLGRLPSAA